MRSTKLLSWSRRLLGLDPAPVPAEIFALDERALRFGRFPRSGEGWEVGEFAQVDLSSGLFSSGPLGGTLQEPAALRGSLQELLRGLETPVSSASLVLPDRWLRVTFTEVGELPRSTRARSEVLRWKLQRLVPFRVDELRVRGQEVRPLANQQEPRRVLLGFAIELLLRQLEEIFAEQGVHIGHIGCRSLSALPALQEGLRGVPVAAVALVQASGYSLVFLEDGEPFLCRYRSLSLDDDPQAAASLVLRDLRLTRVFLEEQLPSLDRGRVLVVAPPPLDQDWIGWLQETLEMPAFAPDRENLALGRQPIDVPLDVLVPMFGASRQAVS